MMARYLGNSGRLLGNAEVYTLVANAGQEDYFVGLVFSDVAGSFVVEQSADGTNWDVASTAYTVTAGTGRTFKEEVFAPNIRIKYTNGATPQAVFRLSAHFSSAGYR